MSPGEEGGWVWSNRRKQKETKENRRKQKETEENRRTQKETKGNRRKQKGLEEETTITQEETQTNHYGQNRIQSLWFGTKGFMMDSFICYRDKTFL